MELLKKLQSYHPTEGNETKMHTDFLSFISTYENCFERSLLTGHVTASALVVDPVHQKVLLLHHKKLGRWLQPGGHCDGNPDTLEVALTEVQEETGLAISVNEAPVFDVDIHRIPEHKGVPEHLHYDVRYLFEASSDQSPEQNHETNAVRWINIRDIENYTTEESILRMIRKLTF